MGIFSCCSSTDKVIEISNAPSPVLVTSSSGKKALPTFYETRAIGKVTQHSGFEKIKIERNEPGDDDVQFDVKFCGICHTDVHIAENEFAELMPTKYPCVPGHELAGIVTKVGRNVRDVKVGSKVGVGKARKSIKPYFSICEQEADGMANV